MPSDGVHLDSAYAHELLERQDTLQAEAWRTLAALDLEAALAPIGLMEVIGSLATGLMVWRDIDLLVIAPGLSTSVAHEAMARYFGHPKIGAIRYRYDYAAQNPANDPNDDRYYYALFYQGAGGHEWKIDISIWIADPPHVERLPSSSLIARLNDETRLAILWIKDQWFARPEYRMTVYSVDIYDAVLDHGVRTPEEFAAYLRERA
ncbi:MAG TPA: hypothetical protein VHR15_18685 [Ktedonobacterales bacterium]|jgi:hypothetical protein|nr:hypothetical protein [Ktedonobacterales bacterium]